MYIKAACFASIALASASLLVLRTPGFSTAALAVLIAWSAARFYYFCFYVVEKYIDPSFRFDGLVSVGRHHIARRAARSPR